MKKLKIVENHFWATRLNCKKIYVELIYPHKEIIRQDSKGQYEEQMLPWEESNVHP